MNNSEKITIDCTPTWSALLPVLLDLYIQQVNKRTHKAYSSEQWHKDKATLEAEFKNMALAADKWNEHCKASQ